MARVNPDDLIDAGGVAELKGVQRGTVYDWCNDFPEGTPGGVPGIVKRIGRSKMWRAQDWRGWTPPGPTRSGPRKRTPRSKQVA